MAEETKTEERTTEEREEQTTETREAPSKERREERREEKREERSAPTETPEKRVDCPDCATDVRESMLALHRFRAHGVDRRATTTEEKRGEGKPTAKRQPPSGTTDKTTEETPPSRWAGVRKGWGRSDAT